MGCTMQLKALTTNLYNVSITDNVLHVGNIQINAPSTGCIIARNRLDAGGIVAPPTDTIIFSCSGISPLLPLGLTALAGRRSRRWFVVGAALTVAGCAQGINPCR